ncbi:MAG: V-type ATP synthase subunit D [Candidatus Anammoximicrobium sp.]|nr:V-type ATP synthase subunit D [Candidatus Anammoximicrobium sp.]
MAEKVKLTRPELKRRRDRLARFERYLPMLKLKQQQLQITLREVARRVQQARQALDEVAAKLARYQSVLADRSGLPLRQWSRPERIRTSHRNVAGVEVPVFEGVEFPAARYSLFGTPAWVDETLADLRQHSRRQAALEVRREEEALLQGELARVIQRVNLFEKVMIPRDREAIRRIRIKLGDEMAAAVGRGKIAKGKLAKVADELPAEPLDFESWEADA